MLDLARSSGRVILDHEPATAYGEAWFVIQRSGGQSAVMVQEHRGTQTVSFHDIEGRPIGYQADTSMALFWDASKFV